MQSLRISIHSRRWPKRWKASFACSCFVLFRFFISHHRSDFGVPPHNYFEMGDGIRKREIRKTNPKKWNYRRTGRNASLFTVKKNVIWIWKAYCRTTGRLLDWEIGDRSTETFERMYTRLERFNVAKYYSDGWSSYRELIERYRLKQTKAETHLIESNNFRQRHWFCRFRRRTCCVSQSLKNLNLTMFLFSYFHVNNPRYKLFDLARWWRLLFHPPCRNFVAII